MRMSLPSRLLRALGIAVLAGATFSLARTAVADPPPVYHMFDVQFADNAAPESWTLHDADAGRAEGTPTQDAVFAIAKNHRLTERDRLDASIVQTTSGAGGKRASLAFMDLDAPAAGFQVALTAAGGTRNWELVDLGECARLAVVAAPADVLPKVVDAVEANAAERPAADRDRASVDRATDPKRAVALAQSIYVSGGNSWRLLDSVERASLLPLVRRRVQAGLPYIGISACTHLTGPTTCATNDTRIATPRDPRALDIAPFQIDTHRTDGAYYLKQGGTFTRHGGETHAIRLLEHLEGNNVPILALREGEIPRVEGTTSHIVDLGDARLFVRGRKPNDVRSEAHLSRPIG